MAAWCARQPSSRGSGHACSDEDYDPEQFARDVRAGHHGGRSQAGRGRHRHPERRRVRASGLSRLYQRAAGRPGAPSATLGRGRLEAYATPRSRPYFPEFFAQYYQHYRYLWMPPEVSLDDVPESPRQLRAVPRDWPDSPTSAATPSPATSTTLKAAHGGARLRRRVHHRRRTHGAQHDDATSSSFYPSEAAYLYALADALHEEYQAIADAGLIAASRPRRAQPESQDDARWTIATRRRSEVQRALEHGIEIINHALQRHSRGSRALPPLLGQHEPARIRRTRRCASIVPHDAQDQRAGVRHRGAPTRATSTSGWSGRTSSCPTARS